MKFLGLERAAADELYSSTTVVLNEVVLDEVSRPSKGQQLSSIRPPSFPHILGNIMAFLRCVAFIRLLLQSESNLTACIAKTYSILNSSTCIRCNILHSPMLKTYCRQHPRTHLFLMRSRNFKIHQSFYNHGTQHY